MKFRKILLAFALLFSIFALVACGGGQTADEGESDPVAEEESGGEETAVEETEETAAEEGEEMDESMVEISFLTPPWGVPPDEEALAQFEEEAGFSVSVQSIQLSDLFSRVQVASATDELPADVIFLTEEAPSNIVATGNMMPLNDLISSTPDLNIDDIERQDFWTIDGDVMGITVYLQLVMMDYNAAKAAEAGFDAPPTTWAELQEQAISIKEQGVDDYPVSMGLIDWSWYLIALSMGDPMFDDDLNPVFADEGSKAREAMAMLFSFVENDLINPEILTAPAGPHAVWFGGSGVFHQAWQGSVAAGNNEDTSQQAPNVEYMLLPEASNTWSFPAGLGIHKNSEHPEEAWQFIQWYLGQANQEAIYNAYGLFPSRTSVQSALNDEGAIQGFDLLVEQGQYVHELPRYTLWWGPFATGAREMIFEAIKSGDSPDATVDALADLWNDLKAEFE